MGKSTLARNTCHYVAERKILSGGIIFVQFKTVRSIFAAVKIIMRTIIRQLDLNYEQKQTLGDQTLTHEAMIEYFIDFFNGEQEQDLKKKKNVTQNRGSSKKILLCLDDAGKIIEHDGEEFTSFLTQLYDECPKLHIIITSNIGVVLGKDIPMKPILLKELSNNMAAELFTNSCGELTAEEIYNLILAD